MKKKKKMKPWLKALLIVLAFGLCYVGAMSFAYNYLYKYPVGFLDTMERNDGARFYRVIYKEKIGSDKKTLLYFAKSNNGVGLDAHVGTLYCKWPDYFANYFCKSTSSYYIPVNTISYGETHDDQHLCYLFGSTSDENTVRVVVTFVRGENDEVAIEMEMLPYEKVKNTKCYYKLGFEKQLAQYPCRIVGYNANDGITFQYKGKPFEEGQYTPEN
ncbi:MAG: hypothetical protein IKX74_07345 [Erysipelotrichaceae bacterium]|nr:hypothetical protein [Erysipelotrichaceae bacterium]MBR5049433.1 hypothetical protein [Erysipelotrichaceae bacterium]